MRSEPASRGEVRVGRLKLRAPSREAARRAEALVRAALEEARPRGRAAAWTVVVRRLDLGRIALAEPGARRDLAERVQRLIERAVHAGRDGARDAPAVYVEDEVDRAVVALRAALSGAPLPWFVPALGLGAGQDRARLALVALEGSRPHLARVLAELGDEEAERLEPLLPPAAREAALVAMLEDQGLQAVARRVPSLGLRALDPVASAAGEAKGALPVTAASLRRAARALVERPWRPRLAEAAAEPGPRTRASGEDPGPTRSDDAVAPPARAPAALPGPEIPAGSWEADGEGRRPTRSAEAAPRGPARDPSPPPEPPPSSPEEEESPSRPLASRPSPEGDATAGGPAALPPASTAAAAPPASSSASRPAPAGRRPRQAPAETPAASSLDGWPPWWPEDALVTPNAGLFLCVTLLEALGAGEVLARSAALDALGGAPALLLGLLARAGVEDRPLRELLARLLPPPPSADPQDEPWAAPRRQIGLLGEPALPTRGEGGSAPAASGGPTSPQASPELDVRLAPATPSAEPWVAPPRWIGLLGEPGPLRWAEDGSSLLAYGGLVPVSSPSPQASPELDPWLLASGGAEGPPVEGPPGPPAAAAVLGAAEVLLDRLTGRGLGWLVARPGRVALGATHLDVAFPLASADIGVRRHGLDVDPGWVPWLGRVVSFHYLEGA